MWTYKQCKTMLTHVFKPRWLVLILLSAGNREFRRGREKEKFDEEERDTKRERKIERDGAKPKEGGEKKIVELAGEDERGNRGDRRVGPIAGRSLNGEVCERRRMKCREFLMEHRTHYAACHGAARHGTARLGTARHSAAWRGM